MRGRVAASIVLAVSVAVGATGCTLMAPQETTRIYEASDGVSGDVGQIAVRNATLITGEANTANLVTTLVNQDTKSHRVKIQTDTGTGTTTTIVTVEAASSLKIGGEDDSKRVQFSDVNTPAGGLHKVFFQYADQTGVQLNVPVLTNQLPEYSTLTPTPTPVNAESE